MKYPVDPHTCKYCGELTMKPYSVLPIGEDYFREDWVCVKCYGRVEYHYDRNHQRYVEDNNGTVKDFGEN